MCDNFIPWASVLFYFIWQLPSLCTFSYDMNGFDIFKVICFPSHFLIYHGSLFYTTLLPIRWFWIKIDFWMNSTAELLTMVTTFASCYSNISFIIAAQYCLSFSDFSICDEVWSCDFGNKCYILTWCDLSSTIMIMSRFY